MADLNENVDITVNKLILKELERLNDNHENMRKDFDSKFIEINLKLSDAKSLEKTVNDHKQWLERVNDVWSPTQMKEAKDEIYQQKGRWQSAVAIIIFIQVIIGIILAVWGNIGH